MKRELVYLSVESKLRKIAKAYSQDTLYRRKVNDAFFQLMGKIGNKINEYLYKKIEDRETREILEKFWRGVGKGCVNFSEEEIMVLTTETGPIPSLVGLIRAEVSELIKPPKLHLNSVESKIALLTEGEKVHISSKIKVEARGYKLVDFKNFYDAKANASELLNLMKKFERY